MYKIILYCKAKIKVRGRRIQPLGITEENINGKRLLFFWFNCKALNNSTMTTKLYLD